MPAVDALMKVATALAKLAEIDPELSADYQLAEDLSQQAQDLALTLTRYGSEIEFDPSRLDELEERLELIRSLKRRYKADSIVEVLAYAENAAVELESIDNSGERLRQLQKRERHLLEHIGDISKRLSRARADASNTLSRAIVERTAGPAHGAYAL